MENILKEIPDISGIFDTHAHYDDSKFDGIRNELLLGLKEKGLVGAITCGCDIPSSLNALKLANEYDFIYAAVGFHPENIGENDDITASLQKIKDMILNNKKAVALGEIGLDYYWDIPKDRQLLWFEEQLKLAKELDIPVIVHDREAQADTLVLLQKYQPKGVLHCFSGSKETAKEILKLGMYIGIGGVVTFKNARKTVEVAQMIPEDKFLLETDCPYLAPVPFRGKLNHSGLINFTAEKIAEIKGKTKEDIINQSLANAKTLFSL